jgi:hypothetical protein
MPLFIISLIIGFFAVYITLPDQRIVYVYPTPENVAVLQYRDKTGTCFSFQQTEIACPKNENEITIIPAQG